MPPPEWRATCLRQLGRGVAAYRAGQLTGSLWALARLGVKLEARLLAQYAAALAPLLANLTRQQAEEVVRAAEVYVQPGAEAAQELAALAEAAGRRLEEGAFFEAAAGAGA
jgi:hypothetical protein